MIREYQTLIESSQEIAIFGHDNPDGDAIGSMLGLGKILENMNKRVSYFASPTPSRIFNFVPGIDKIKDDFDYKNKYDLIIFVDFSPYVRTVFTKGKYDYFDAKRLLVIDHHIGDTPNHAIVLKDENVDSNCERIFENTKEIRSDYYDSEVATYLYMGIITDTGNFQYDKQDDRSLRNAADLVTLGANKSLLTRMFFGTISREQLQFFSNVFPRLTQIGNIGYIYFTPEDYLPLGLDKEQAGGYLSTIIQKIPGIDLLLLCRGEDNSIKISLRSKTPNISAQQIASSLGGGGHFYAAGAKIELQPGQQPIEIIETIIKNIKQ